MSAARSRWTVIHDVSDLASISDAAAQRALRDDVTLINILASLVAIHLYIHAPGGPVKKRGDGDLTPEATVYTLGPMKNSDTGTAETIVHNYASYLYPLPGAQGRVWGERVEKDGRVWVRRLDGKIEIYAVDVDGLETFLGFGVAQ